MMPPSTKNIISFSKSKSKTPDLSRLPKSVLPKRYELKIEVDPELKCYSGKVNIRIIVQDNSNMDNTIWLHSKNLDISSVEIQFSQFAMPVEALEVIEVPEKGCIGLTFGKDVKLDKGTRAWLLIEFHGKLTQNLEGFYCNPYKDPDGNLRTGCATMFAATEARSCFPCFDEPDFKAIFALEVTVPKKLMVISNMPVMDTEYVDNNRQKLHVKHFL